MYHYNYKFWLATTEEINDLILYNDVFRKIKPKIQTHDIFANLYARYIGLVNNLSYLYDQTGQVQKRKLIKTLLETATRRLLELRNELKKIELSEFIYLDKMLIQKKLTPFDIQLIHPYYFPFKRKKEIQELIDNIKEPIEHLSTVDQNNPNEIINSDTDKGQYLKKPSILSNRKNLISESIDSQISTDLKIITDKKQKQTKMKFQYPIEKEKIQISPQRQAIIDAVNMIKKHDRARRARLLLTNIKFHPTYFTVKDLRQKTEKVGFSSNFHKTLEEINLTHKIHESSSLDSIHLLYSKEKMINDNSSKNRSTEICEKDSIDIDISSIEIDRNEILEEFSQESNDESRVIFEKELSGEIGHEEHLKNEQEGNAKCLLII